MDRLMACLSHLALAKKEGPEVLSQDKKKEKKDVEVMQRLSLLQASCISVAYGCPFIETASQSLKRANNSMLGQSKVLPGVGGNSAANTHQLTQQKNQTKMSSGVAKPQPSGKVSTVKNDGLNKKFTKHTGSN